MIPGLVRGCPLSLHYTLFSFAFEMTLYYTLFSFACICNWLMCSLSFSLYCLSMVNLRISLDSLITSIQYFSFIIPSGWDVKNLSNVYLQVSSLEKNVNILGALILIFLFCLCLALGIAAYKWMTIQTGHFYIPEPNHWPEPRPGFSLVFIQLLRCHFLQSIYACE